MILLFLSALTIAFSGAIMPGSLLTYTIKKSLSDGWHAGFIIIAGHAVLELALIILIFLGFGTILEAPVTRLLISFIGGAMLVYMGIDMIRGATKNTVKVDINNNSTKSRGMFLSGIFLSATNPYFLLWWTIVGLGFIMTAYSTYGIIGIVIYYIGHICADFIWYGFISILVGKTRKFMKEKLYRFLIAFLGILLIFFGIRFILYDLLNILS